MKYTITTEGASRIARVDGQVTFQEQKDFRELLNEMFAQASKSYVFDLTAVSHIDSAGLGMFLIGRKRAQENGAGVVLRHPPSNVRHTLELAKFHELFTVEG